MGCVYSDFEGKCEMWDGETDDTCDSVGYCQVEDDPDPNCDNFADESGE